MFVTVPQRHNKYVDLLVRGGWFANVELAKRFVFENGLDEAESDLSMGSSEPDMQMSLLEGKQTTIQVPDEPEYRLRLERISQGFKVEPARAWSEPLKLDTMG